MPEASRLLGFVKRHGSRAPGRLFSEAVTRAYRREGVRRLVRPFFATRTPERWVFPVGCYNSGTTITQALLAAHPEVRSMPREGVRFTSVLPQPEDLGWTRMWIGCPEYMEMPAVAEPEKALRILEDWAPWWGSGGTTFMDKSITNGTRMPWLDANFGHACFIGIVRNGYCAAEGIRRRARPRGEPAAKLGGCYTLRMAGEQWVAANEKMLADSEKVGRFEFVFYEDLVRDPVGMLGRFWDFLGLERPATRETTDGVEIAGKAFPLRNMNPESLSRLTREDVEEINPVIAPLQERFGYEVLR